MLRNITCSYRLRNPRLFFKFVLVLGLGWLSFWHQKVCGAELLYVSLNNNTIVRYDISQLSASAVQNSESVFASSGMNDPRGLAFDVAGNLYTANFLANTITRYDNAGTLMESSFASTGMNSPVGLAFDSNGNLYAANYFGNTLSKYNSSGSMSLFASGLNGPQCLAFDLAGILYATNGLGNTITRYDSAGSLLEPAFANSGMNEPVGLAFDAAGDLYIANYYNNNITHYDSSGSLLSGPFASVGLNNPYGLAVDSAGNFYVTNFGDNTIAKFNAAGTYQFSWSSAATPRNLAFRPTIVPEPSSCISVAVAATFLAVITRKRK